MEEETSIVKEENEIKGYFIHKNDLWTMYYLVEYLIGSTSLPKVTKDYLQSFLKEWNDIIK